MLTSFRDLEPLQRQALLEKLALTLQRNASWAADEGDDALEMALRSVGTAILSAAGELSTDGLEFAEDVAAKALGLITTFHLRHPAYPLGPTLH
ncbi:hypothetical protein SB748_24730 [Rhizobium sp. SIMBA_035]